MTATKFKAKIKNFIICWAILGMPGINLAQGPPIHTDTPIMLGVQGRGLRTFAKIIRQTTHAQGDVTLENEQKATLWITPVAVPYNFLNDRIQLGILLPFLNLQVTSQFREVSSSGLGDIQLFFKYLILQHDRKNETIRVASKIGMKLPTGDETKVPPLGTGSTDFFITSVAAWIKDRAGVYLEGIYRFNTSHESLDYGNSFSYNLAFGFRLLPAVYETYPARQLNGFVEINGTTSNKNKLRNTKLNDSGGTVIFFSPGLQYIGGRRWLIETSLQIPLVKDLNGTQLASDWTVLLGSRILIF